MKLNYIKIRNYRSFGEENANGIVLKEGINLIVGENNAGKSNILRAAELCMNREQPDANSWHSGMQEKELLVEMEVELNEGERTSFIRHLAQSKESQTQENLKRLNADIGNKLSFKFSSVSGRYLKIKDLYISGNQGRLSEPRGLPGQGTANWSEILDKYCASGNSSVFEAIKEKLGSNEDKVCVFNSNIEQLTLDLLDRKLKNFSEVRQRPAGVNQSVLESYDGARVADVLATLKMGNRQQRKKFALIKQEFMKLFPNLGLEVTHERSDNPPRIVIEKIPIEYEVPIDRVGAGIGEMAILLTHLIASEGMIFGLDMPELHFHPHAQRLLLDILKKHSQKNQIIIITHSPAFFESQMVSNLTVVRDVEGATIISQLPEGYFNNEEMDKLERHLDSHNKEFLFSKAVLIVDGETELGAMPVFSKILNEDFDTLGISLVRTGKHFGIFAKLLKGLNFPYLVMADKDALENIEGSIDVNGQKIDTSPVFCDLEKIGFLTEKEKGVISEVKDSTTVIEGKRVYYGVIKRLRALAQAHDIYVLPLDFEAVLKGSSYRDIYEEARRLFDSKVTCGRYCAQEIGRQNRKVPIKFARVIEMVAKKVGIRENH